MRTFGKAVVGACLVLLVLSLVPFLLLAPYAAPVADDFGYGAPIYYALRSGLGAPGALAALVENIRYTYLNWQGTFASVLLFSIQPGVFGTGLYAITPVVMLSAIIAPVFLALGLLRGTSRGGRVIIGCVVAFLSVQYLPSIADGIYWWNGAAHYLAFWGLAVLVVTWQIRLGREKKTTAGFYALLTAGCLGALFVGGGNYSTALVFALASGALALYALVERQPSRVVWGNALMALCAVVGLVVSVVAPGNAVRQAGFARLGALEAIGRSLVQGAKTVVELTDLRILGGLLLTVPIFLALVRKKEYTFRFPPVVLLGGFGAFAALYTPPFYAMGVSDVERMNNLFWLAYLFWIFGSAFYLAGWAARRVTMHQRAARYAPWAVCAVGGLVLAVTLTVQMKGSNVYLAYSDLKSGVAEEYGQERAARDAVYADKSAPLPRFVPISRYPACFPAVKTLTWASDLLVDGLPADLLTYHACGGEVTFVGLGSALEFFDVAEDLTTADFSKTFYINGEVCVPLREFCDRMNFLIGYDVGVDTISIIRSHGALETSE